MALGLPDLPMMPSLGLPELPGAPGLPGAPELPGGGTEQDDTGEWGHERGHKGHKK
jgi:hypothetical protein